MRIIPKIPRKPLYIGLLLLLIKWLYDKSAIINVPEYVDDLISVFCICNSFSTEIYYEESGSIRFPFRNDFI